jgi:sulfite reductase (ferredoxin)
VRVGGGLSADPHLGVRLNAFVQQDQAAAVVRKITELFRDQQGLRESRDRARMKHLFLREGWTAETFLAELNRRLGYQLDPAVEEKVPDDIYRDHVGIHRQKQDGLCYVGLSVLRGRMTAAQLNAVAGLATRYGNGQLRTTVMQNLVVVNVPTGKAQELARELQAIGLRHCLHRQRVLQAGHHRDQGLYALDCRRTRRPAARLRPTSQAARYWLPQ